MIKIFPASSRYHGNLGWLNSYMSFSFAHYHDPETPSFGPLRVLNDDFVEPGKGFGMHPHKNMEIVSIVLDGHLQHTDSTGHSAISTFGGVQRMTAGTGIVHSEMNQGDNVVNFLQLWFDPEQQNLEPSYQVTQYDPEQMKNALLPVVAKASTDSKVCSIRQDITIYLSDLEADRSISYDSLNNRRTFLFVIEGALVMNDLHHLETRDSARITDVSSLQFKALKDTRFMLIDLP
ncbi:pirin family protein [Paenibacillus gansuensis]|uniref:Pirin family protein n=1 Tax=Paenibacillus gansuensis TaxID=306542 RepID=A0ABW5P951_9BACL